MLIVQTVAGLPTCFWSRWLLACVLSLLISVTGLVAPIASAAATADEAMARQSAVKFQFDIAAQPLEDALYAFGAVTGVEVLADGDMVKNRRSTEIRGEFTVPQAIRLLLIGTGLEAQSIGVRAITLAPQRREQSSVVVYRRYSGLLQRAAVRRLCGQGEEDLGAYRIAMQLWLADTGNVRDVELLSSTGDHIRDERIRSLLQGMRVEKLPAGMPQPVVMVILPRSQRESGDCNADAPPPASAKQDWPR